MILFKAIKVGKMNNNHNRMQVVSPQIRRIILWSLLLSYNNSYYRPYSVIINGILEPLQCLSSDHYFFSCWGFEQIYFRMTYGQWIKHTNPSRWFKWDFWGGKSFRGPRCFDKLLLKCRVVPLETGVVGICMENMYTFC